MSRDRPTPSRPGRGGLANLAAALIGAVALATVLAGQPLVVNFLASWCPPCVAEMRDALEPAHAALGDDVAFLGIAMQDTPKPPSTSSMRAGVTYDLARDPDGQLFAALGLAGMPATVYVTADSQVVDRHTGSLTHDQLRFQIEENLAP